MAKGYSARGGFGGSQGQMMRQQQMQQKIMQMQQQMAEDDGKMYWVDNAEVPEWNFDKITDETVVSGKKELKALTIQPDAVDPQDVEMLQDLVISAVNEALRQADEAMNNSMNSFTGGLNIPGLM